MRLTWGVQLAIIAVGIAIVACGRGSEKPPPPVPGDAAIPADPLAAVRVDDLPIDWTHPLPVTPPGGLAEDGYAGALACRPCHEEIAESYARHAMARTGLRPVADLDAAWLARIFDAGAASVLHEGSGFRYRPLRQGDRYFVEEYLLAPDGERVHSWVQPITHGFASGTSGMAFIFRVGDRYHRVPISYFDKQGLWGLDPGFARGNPRFSSTLEVGCVSCHSDAPRRSAAVPDAFFDPLPPGVGCERCHGPGETHVASLAPEDIVNPAKLSPSRQLEICTQCHLEIASVPRAGRHAFDYRPGEPLDAFRADYLPEPAEPDRVSLLAHPERLVRSACFRESQGRLRCTTCHDPHTSSREQPASWWRAPCEGCHQDQEQPCTEDPAVRAARGDDCVACHMRAGPAQDAPHVVVTDHWIQRRPPPIRPGPAALPQRLVPWSAYVGEPIAAGDDALAVEAVAYGRVELTVEAERRAALAIAGRPRVPELYELVAAGHRRRGRTEDAARTLAALLRIDPDRRSVLLDYALAMLELGDGEQAEHALDRALALDPDYQDALEIRGMVLLRAGEVDRARAYLASAAAAGPDGGPARVGLAALALDAGRTEEAIEHLEAARRIEPGDSWIFDQLAAAYAARGDLVRAAEIEDDRTGLSADGRAPKPTQASQWLPPNCCSR